MIRIVAPGIDCKVGKADIGIIIATAIMDNIYYEGTKDILCIMKDNEVLMEVKLKKNESEDLGFDISGKWYCLPDAEDVVGNYLAELLE